VTSDLGQPVTTGTQNNTYDAVVVGAGFSGLYMVHRLRELGLSVMGLEAGSDIGGTWYWNRYPGARTDTVHYLYCYTFSEELRKEWRWKERFPPQAEMLEYFDFVADRLDLRRHFTFDTRVASAHFDESSTSWAVTTERGDVYTATYFIPAVGPLSTPNTPPIPGIETFEGEVLHTAQWPHEGVDFTGKRVAVIGTGSTGIQLIPHVAAEAKELTVFQRTPNYVAPARNEKVTEDEHNDVLDRYTEIIGQARNHPFSSDFAFPTRSALEVDPAERERVYELAWQKGGFHLLMDTFTDVSIDLAANDTLAEFIRAKIRSIVRDEETARILTPVNYPYGAKRPPAGTNYYETFNRDNVSLVDISQDGIDGIVGDGIVVADTVHEADVIVFATGFDAGTGTLNRMDIRGGDGVRLRDEWAHGPQTYLGFGSPSFPNMLMVFGPQTPFATVPPAVQQNVDWIVGCLRHMANHGYSRVEASTGAAQDWTRTVIEAGDMSLVRHGAKVNSWFAGANIVGKPQVIVAYFGGANNYFDQCDAVARAGYEGFDFS